VDVGLSECDIKLCVTGVRPSATQTTRLSVRYFLMINFYLRLFLMRVYNAESSFKDQCSLLM